MLGIELNLWKHHDWKGGIFLLWIINTALSLFPFWLSHTSALNWVNPSYWRRRKWHNKESKLVLIWNSLSCPVLELVWEEGGIRQLSPAEEEFTHSLMDEPFHFVSPQCNFVLKLCFQILHLHLTYAVLHPAMSHFWCLFNQGAVMNKIHYFFHCHWHALLGYIA